MQMNYNRPRGREGLIYDTNPATIDTFGSKNRIYYGTLMVREATSQLVKAPESEADLARREGIAAVGQYGSNADAELPYYSAGQPIAGVVNGRVWVRVDNAVTRGGAVSVRIRNTTTNTDPLDRYRLQGVFSSLADNDHVVLASGARWLTDAPAGGLAVLEIDI